ncbi:hypothetical protein ACF068_05705 [Streptomyces sp. NPDC016309]|uniref:nucleotidyltransferase domain-containing protein n=1 Tax=Streptomyces sp. NPDC016309 TaxID=3364965 RepID=UPI0036FA28F9
MTTDHSPRVPDLPPAVRQVVDGLAGLPTVRSVRVGGSRARGGPTRPDSDWDLLVYVDDLPALTELRPLLPPDQDRHGPVEYATANEDHPLEEAELSIPLSPRIDVCFRPIARLRHEERRAARGTFTVHAYPKTAGGVPSYILLSEAALSAPVHGDVGAPPCPAELVRTAVPWWRGRAACALLLAVDHVTAGERVGALGHVLAAATSAAHAALIARGHWYPITKRLLNEPAALGDEARRTLDGLSPATLTTDVVRRVADDLGTDLEAGLDWLAGGEHLTPGAGPRRTHPGTH